MADKRMSEDEVISQLSSGMTLGIGGWGSRRKPMSLVRALLRSDITDLTVVSYGGPDIGLLAAAGKIRHLVTSFVSLDSIPLEPQFRRARETGGFTLTEYDEGMLQWGLYAAGINLPFLPTRAGLGSDVTRVNPELKLVADPYNGEELVAVPALKLDAAFVHMNRADARGNAQYLGPDPYFDDLYCMAAERAYVSCEKVVPTAELGQGHPASLVISRWMTAGVVEAPNGAHFTSCVPDYDRDESFQAEYAAASADPEAWEGFHLRYLAGSEKDYQQAVTARKKTENAA
ncbi:MAG: CoA transferase subunit A [Actinomycetota bacterium]